MARVSGVDLPNNKRIDVALTYVFGIGPATAKGILAKLGGAIKPEARVKELTEHQVGLINSLLAKEYKVEGELRREVFAVGVPMRRTVDGEIISFNCSVPAFMLKKGQLEEDLGPRLVAMVRNIEASLGMH